LAAIVTSPAIRAITGASHPAGAPPVLDTDPMERTEAKPVQAGASSATADQIVDSYANALGGLDALRKISSRVETGTILAGGRETPIEVLAKAPNKRMSITHMPNGESITAFDGSGGWMGNTGRPPRAMSDAESAAAGLDAEFSLALRLKTMFTQLRAGHPDQVGDVPCDTLIAMRDGQPPVRLFFDRKSGLLVRMVRYGETPLGRNPTQIDYADYREVDGVKVPYRWTLARPNGRFTIQIKDVKQNVPVDDAKFLKPASDVK
jgi:outer membrane lipoprotein-sorting protein